MNLSGMNPRVARLQRQLNNKKQELEKTKTLNGYVAKGALTASGAFAIPVLAAGSIGTGIGIALFAVGGLTALAGLLYGGGHLVNKSRVLASDIRILEGKIERGIVTGHDNQKP